MIKSIIIKISDDGFYDDAQLLARSFFSGAGAVRHDVVSGPSLTKADRMSVQADDIYFADPDTVIINADPFLPGKEKYEWTRGELHDCFKRALYEALVSFTGRTLPWGFLTGVRPAKRAMELLRTGDAGVSDEEIIKGFSDKYMTSERKARLALTVAKNEIKILERNNIPADKNIYRGFSFYAGIPFCPTTCLYCSFPSVPIGKCNETLVDDYINALCREIESSCYIYRRSLEGKGIVADKLKPSSVYIGGGTPTALEPEQLSRVIDCIRENLNVDESAEFCAEAGRPDSITARKLEVLKHKGVNRISVNPQTMNEKTLELIGRSHSVEDVYRGFELARATGFENINMDIILGLPGEGTEEVKETLSAIEKLAPDSLTVHSLAIKRAARLNTESDNYRSLSKENSQELIDMTAELAHRLDMSPYYMYRQQNMAGNFENTGYARAGKESLYNIVIMEEVQDILAVGAGASSKFLMGDNRFERAVNVKDIGNYIDRVGEMCDRKKKLIL